MHNTDRIATSHDTLYITYCIITFDSSQRAATCWTNISLYLQRKGKNEIINNSFKFEWNSHHNNSKQWTRRDSVDIEIETSDKKEC